ncbi:hypothetical protein LIGMFLNB_10019 (plasmid) [Aeromonas hydrophila]
MYHLSADLGKPGTGFFGAVEAGGFGGGTPLNQLHRGTEDAKRRRALCVCWLRVKFDIARIGCNHRLARLFKVTVTIIGGFRR